MSGASGPDGAGLQVTELAARYAALRQAARSRGAQPHDVLDAAFTELEGAIELLRAAEAGPGGSGRPAARAPGWRGPSTGPGGRGPALAVRPARPRRASPRAVTTPSAACCARRSR